jgi:hypothetical protein
MKKTLKVNIDKLCYPRNGRSNVLLALTRVGESRCGKDRPICLNCLSGLAFDAQQARWAVAMRVPAAAHFQDLSFTRNAKLRSLRVNYHRFSCTFDAVSILYVLGHTFYSGFESHSFLRTVQSVGATHNHTAISRGEDQFPVTAASPSIHARLTFHQPSWLQSTQTFCLPVLIVCDRCASLGPNSVGHPLDLNACYQRQMKDVLQRTGIAWPASLTLTSASF